MNIDDRIKTLAAEIAEANAKAEAFSRQADKKEANADKLEAECKEKDEEIALLKSKIERIKRNISLK